MGDREYISDKQGVILIILFVLINTMLLPVAAEAGQDIWLAIFLGMMAALPMVIIYGRILTLFPQKTFFDIVEMVLGKFFGKAINLLYTWFAFHLAALVLRDFAEFINTTTLPETPMMVALIFPGLLCLWVLKHGIEVLARMGEFFVVVLLVLIFAFGFFLIPEIQFQRIQPILGQGIKPVVKGAFSVFSFPFAETVIFTMIFTSLKREKNHYGVFIKGITIGGMILLMSKTTDVLVGGVDLYTTMYFPGYAVIRRISIGSTVESVEILAAVVVVMGAFFKLSICLLGGAKGLSKVFNCKDYRFLVTPMVLLLINMAYFIADSTMEFVGWTAKIWPIYALPFQVILPIGIWVAAEFRTKIKQ